MIKTRRTASISFHQLLFFFVLTCFVFSGMSAVVNQRPFAEFLSFFAFQLLCIFVPGLAIFSFLRGNDTDGITAIAISYGMGYALNVAEYYMLYPFGLQQFAKVLALIITLLAGVVLWLRRDKLVKLETARANAVWFLAFFSAWLIVMFVAVIGTYITPDLTGNASYCVDAGYWVNLTTAAGQGYPPVRLNALGMTEKYYYLTNLQMAWMKNVCGIGSFTITYTYSALLPSIMWLGSMYAVMHCFTEKKLLIFGFIFLMLFTSELPMAGIPVTTYRFYYCSGYLFCTAYGYLLLYFVLRQFREEKMRFSLLAAASVCLISGLGAYASNIMVPFAAVGVWCLVCVFSKERERRRTGLVYGAVLLCIFVVVYFCFLYSPTTSLSSGSINNQGGVGLLSNLLNSKIGLYFSAFYATRVGKLLTFPLLAFFWFLTWHPLIQPMLFIMLALLLACRQRLDAWMLALLGGIFMGTAAGMALSLFGTAQVRFSACVVPLSALFGFYVLEILWKRIATERLAEVGLGTISVMLTLISTCCFVQISSIYIGSGANSLYAAVSGTQRSAACPRSFIACNDAQYDALSWIRDNTPENAVLLCDRSQVESESQKGFIYSMFSERQMLMELGYSYRDEWLDAKTAAKFGNITQKEAAVERRKLANAVYSNEPGAIETVKEQGVDYIVQTESLTPDFKPNEALLEEVYTNGELSIYQIR